MNGLEKYQKVGADYIVEVEGNEAIKTRQSYFVCLLCSLTQNIAQLAHHLSSEAHCINFIEKHFPSTFQIINRKKEFSNPQILTPILSCIRKEIAKNTSERNSHKFSHSIYQVAKSTIERDILRFVKPYDESKKFVKKMNKILESSFSSSEVPTDASPTASSNVLQPNVASESLRSDHSITLREVFKQELLTIAEEIDEAYIAYWKEPMTHPKYNEEWQMFHSKHQELIESEGYMPLWVKHFGNRMKEMKIVEYQQRRNHLCHVVYGDTETQDQSSDENKRQDSNTNVIELSEESEDESITPLKRRKIDAFIEDPTNSPAPQHENELAGGSDDGPSLDSESREEQCDDPQEPSVNSDIKKMVIAIQIAYDLFKHGQLVEPKCLEQLVVRRMIEIRDQEQLKPEVQAVVELSDFHIIHLYENFPSLNSSAQGDFASALKIIEQKYPERYEKLKNLLNIAPDLNELTN